MSNSRKLISRERLIAELRSLPRGVFWIGFFCFAAAASVTRLPQVPGGNRPIFLLSAILISFGLLDAHRRVRITAAIFLILAILAAVDGEKHHPIWHMFERHDLM